MWSDSGALERPASERQGNWHEIEVSLSDSGLGCGKVDVMVADLDWMEVRVDGKARRRRQNCGKATGQRVFRCVTITSIGSKARGSSVNLTGSLSIEKPNRRWPAAGLLRVIVCRWRVQARLESSNRNMVEDCGRALTDHIL